MRARRRRVRSKVALGHTQRVAGLHALDMLAHGVAVVGPDCRVLFANAAADSLLDAGAWIGLADGFLAARGSPLTAGLRRAVAACFGAPPACGTALLASANHGQLRVLTLPIAAGSELSHPWQRPLALVVLVRPDTDQATAITRFRAIYALTSAETRLVARLVEGASAVEAACALGVSEATVRSQIRSLLAKTGARRLADLARLFFTLPQLAR